jgi:drug/metabolite transporter (DMT)-like permease
LPLINKRQTAFLQIFFTTMLWGTTYVLVRMGLTDLGPLMLAGIRYTLAGLILLPVLKVKNINISHYKKNFWQLALLGILSFTIGNGSSGFALEYLPSTTVSFLTSLTTPLVLLFSIFILNEIPKVLQVAGVALSLVGLVMYFSPQRLVFDNPGYAILIISLLGFTFYSILGRFVARSREVPFLVQTAIPFLVGGGLLLVLAVIFEGFPVLTLKSGIIIIWMAIVNSIIGYLLYNQALTELTALEVNVVMKLSPFFTAIYAFFLLGEKITFSQVLAMGVVFLGVYLVQFGNKNKTATEVNEISTN